MKRGVFTILGLLFVVGCMDSETLRLQNQKNLTKISLGMTKKEVMNIMGYKSVGARGRGEHQPSLPAANNPYKSETLKTGGKTCEMLYYLTDNKRDDGAITDDELTPMFFEDGKLIGWGQNFLK